MIGEGAILTAKALKNPPVDIRHFGCIPYAEALTLQRDMAAKRTGGEIPDTLLLMEHPPTYTLGLAGKDANFRVSKAVLIARGFAIHRVDRGGDVTFHGPGQLVGYPIMDVAARGNDIRRYVSGLETVIIETLSAFGLTARHMSGYPGVWIGEQKIAAIGIRINAAGISTHGFAVNVNTDLDGFTSIIPCGLANKSVTSMAELMGMPVSMAQVRSVLADAFIKIFG